MANINPALIGLTPLEKRRHYARLYREKTRDVYRQYQRDYQRVLRNDPDYHKKVIERRIAELHDQMAKAQAAADELISCYQTELTALLKKQKEQQNG